MHSWGQGVAGSNPAVPTVFERFIDQLGTKPAIVPIWPQWDEQDVSKTKPGQMRVAPESVQADRAGVAGRCLGRRSLGMWVRLPEAGQGPPQLSA